MASLLSLCDTGCQATGATRSGPAEGVRARGRLDDLVDSAKLRALQEFPLSTAILAVSNRPALSFHHRAVMSNAKRLDLTHDLFLPTLLFAALGGMTWAVRGCSGFGAAAGCLFAGVTWGAAWWFIARDPAREQLRRYASGWIILAVTLGVGLSGARGWMQWPSFFEGRLSTDFERGEFEPISRAYGFLWLFIAGVPWAGIGACLLAWTGSLRTTRWWHWMVRTACGLGMAYLCGASSTTTMTGSSRCTTPSDSGTRTPTAAARIPIWHG